MKPIQMATVTSGALLASFAAGAATTSAPAPEAAVITAASAGKLTAAEISRALGTPSSIKVLASGQQLTWKRASGQLQVVLDAAGKVQAARMVQPLDMVALEDGQTPK